MTIHREIKEMSFEKKKECPKQSVGQLERIPQCGRAFRIRHFSNKKIVILYDEKYFPPSNFEIKGINESIPMI